MILLIFSLIVRTEKNQNWSLASPVIVLGPVAGVCENPAPITKSPGLKDLGVDVAVEEDEEADRHKPGGEKPEPMGHGMVTV